MASTEDLIRNVVAEVLKNLNGSGLAGRAHAAPKSFVGRYGVFTCVDEAVAAATEASTPPGPGWTAEPE